MDDAAILRVLKALARYEGRCNVRVLKVSRKAIEAAVDEGFVEFHDLDTVLAMTPAGRQHWNDSHKGS